MTCCRTTLLPGRYPVPLTSSYVCFDRRDGEQPRKYVNKSTNKQSIARVHSTPLKISLLLLFHSVWPSAHRNPSIGIKALDQPPSERPMVRQPLAAQSPCAPFVPPRGAPERPAIGPVIRMPARLGLASGTGEIRITMDRPQSPRFAASLLRDGHGRVQRPAVFVRDFPDAYKIDPRKMRLRPPPSASDSDHGILGRVVLGNCRHSHHHATLCSAPQAAQFPARKLCRVLPTNG
jgi:hypothetical protein